MRQVERGYRQLGTKGLLLWDGPESRGCLTGHRQDLAAEAEPRYPGDVALPMGEAGQTKAGVILASQLRTISLRRVRSQPVGSVVDPPIRWAVRAALAHHLGLDIPAIGDGAR